MDGTKGSNAPKERLRQQKNMHFVPDDHGHDPFVLPPEPKKIHIHISHLLSTKQDNLNEQAHKLREQITALKLRKRQAQEIHLPTALPFSTERRQVQKLSTLQKDILQHSTKEVMKLRQLK